MRKTDWGFLAVGLAMLAAAAAAPALKPVRAAQDALKFDLEQALPGSFGDWTVDTSIAPIPPTTDVQASLDRLYQQVVSRTYVNGRREHVMLTVAYGGDQSDALKAHRQEVCYAAQGFKIKALEHGKLHVGGVALPVTRLLAVRGRRSEPVTYWLTMGDRVVLGRLERLLVQLRFGLTGRVPDGLLVRVSNLSTDPRRAFDAHAEFAAALRAGMKPRDVERFFGSARS